MPEIDPDALQSLTDRVAALEQVSAALTAEVRDAIKSPLEAVRASIAVLAAQVGPPEATLTVAPAFINLNGPDAWGAIDGDVGNPANATFAAGTVGVHLPDGHLIRKLRVFADVFTAQELPPTRSVDLKVSLIANDLRTGAAQTLGVVSLRKGGTKGEATVADARVDNAAKLYSLACTLDIQALGDLIAPQIAEGLVRVHAFQVDHSPAPPPVTPAIH